MTTPQPETRNIRILLIDDHVLVRAGLRMLIESHPGLVVVGEAGDRRVAMSLVLKHLPDIALLDLDLGDGSGLDLIPEIRRETPSTKILVLTGLRDALMHRKAIRLGAMGVVQKEVASDVVLKAIERVHAGEVWLDRTAMASLLSEMSQAAMAGEVETEGAPTSLLSARERQVIALIGKGLNNRRIAEKLYISETTVRHHLTSIFSKLGVSDRLELLLYAYKKKLVEPPT